MTLKRKIGGAALALALVAGAIPGVISSASAVETGQMLDKGPRWPHKSLHYVTIVIGTAAAIATIVLLTRNKNDRPTSP